MLSTAKVRFEGVNALSGMQVFMYYGENGEPDWKKSHGILKIASNRTLRNGSSEQTFSNYYDVDVRSANQLAIVAGLVPEGQPIAILEGWLNSYQQDTNKINPNTGRPYQKNILSITLSTIQLGPRSFKANLESVTDDLTTAFSVGQLHATSPVQEIVTCVKGALTANSKKLEFNESIIQQTGKWGYASVWDSRTGQMVTPNPNYIAPVLPQNIMQEITPEAIAEKMGLSTEDVQVAMAKLAASKTAEQNKQNAGGPVDETVNTTPMDETVNTNAGDAFGEMGAP